MSPTRRTFLKWAATLGSALGLSPLGSRPPAAAPAPASKRRHVGRAPAPLNILILGGTGFTGPEQVEYAIARGHRVTLFNRNKTRPEFFKGKVAEELVGDLNNDTSALEGRKFDVVIDNPTTYPAWVRNAAKYLAGNTKHYMFISTTSVYSDQSVIGIDEQSPTTPMPPDLDPYTLVPAHAGQYYGALKTRAEKEVEAYYPAINTIIRPCLIVGPLDRTDRLEAREFGLYNAIGPAKPLTIAEMLYGVKAITTAGAQFTWVPWEFLQTQNVRPWRNMTVWQPPYGRTAGYQRRNSAKAIAKGLTFRPLAVTAKDTLDWHKTRPQKEQDATLNGEINGLAMSREKEVLAAWKAKQQ